MSDKMLVDAQLKKLLAAFPMFKPRPDTLALYMEHMGKMTPTALAKAVSISVESGGRFPTIFDLRKRSGTLGENVVHQEPRPEPIDDRSGANWIIDALPRDRKELYRQHFAIGQERAESHMEEQLAAGAAFREAHPEQAKW